MKHLPKIKKCPQCRKTIYNTQKSAHVGMMVVISHDPHADMFDLHTYPCEYCGGWHFGHKKYYEKTLQQGATA